MEKNYVEIQGRFSSDGRLVDYKSVCSIVNELLDSVSGAFKNKENLHRMKITVEVEDLGADIKFCKPTQEKPAVEPQVLPAPQCVTAGKLIPAQGIDPAPEVVA